jgi:hypothetical protein
LQFGLTYLGVALPADVEEVSVVAKLAEPGREGVIPFPDRINRRTAVDATGHGFGKNADGDLDAATLITLTIGHASNGKRCKVSISARGASV